MDDTLGTKVEGLGDAETLKNQRRCCLGGRGGKASMGALVTWLGRWRGLARGWSSALWVTQPSNTHESYSPTLEKHVHLCQALISGLGAQTPRLHTTCPGLGGTLSPVLRVHRPAQTHHNKASAAWALTRTVPLERFEENAVHLPCARQDRDPPDGLPNTGPCSV